MTVLHLATYSKQGDLVLELLRDLPKEHLDKMTRQNNSGNTILHQTATSSQAVSIASVLLDMEIPMAWLVKRLDNKGNTILHMAATKRDHYVPEKLRGPVTFTTSMRVQNLTPPHLIDHHNSMQQTAQGLFADANNELRNSARSWIRNTAQGCSVVAVLFATVAFASAYTLPGGVEEKTGRPILRTHPLFLVFAITDVLSLSFSLTAVVTFLSLLTSSYRLEDFKRSLPYKLILDFIFLILSVTMMTVAFAATVFLIIQNQGNWRKHIMLGISFLPVSIFALSHIPLFSALSKAYKYLMKKAAQWRVKSTPKFVSDYDEFESINSSHSRRCQCTSSIIV